jgi:Tfp pilus assembly protein PilN
MIKINLVGEGRRPVVARAASAGLRISRRAELLLGAMILLGLLLAGGNFLWLRHKINLKKAEIAEAQVEVERLAPIIREVEAFKAKKADLENKIRVISTLKANQRGPVKIMDYVSTAVPDLLWLGRMEVSTKILKVRGQAFNTNAVAKFIEQLDAVEEFEEPVLLDMTREGRVYNFEIDVPYSFAPKVPLAEAAATPVAAGG